MLKAATIESIGSSTRIEGSKLSDREVQQLLSNLEIKSFATHDEQEVAGYADRNRVPDGVSVRYAPSDDRTGGLAEQVRRLEKKVEHEKIVLAAMPALQLQIVEFARAHGRVTIGEAIKLTGASRNTLKPHFRTLVKRGALDQHGSGRGVWYDLH